MKITKKQEIVDGVTELKAVIASVHGDSIEYLAKWIQAEIRQCEPNILPSEIAAAIKKFAWSKKS
jgi:hypothetical protein